MIVTMKPIHYSIFARRVLEKNRPPDNRTAVCIFYALTELEHLTVPDEAG